MMHRFSFVWVFAALLLSAPLVVSAQGKTTEACSLAAVQNADLDDNAVCIPGEQESTCAELIGGGELCDNDINLLCCILLEDTACLTEVRSDPQGATSAGCVARGSCTNPGSTEENNAKKNLVERSVTGQVMCPGGQVCCSAKTTPLAGMIPLSGAGSSPSTPGNDSAKPAQEGGAAVPGKPVTLPDPLGGVTVPVFFGNVIRVFSSVAGAIALLMFVYGGIMWILSGGEQAKVQASQKILVNATIGLVLIFGAYVFTSAILQSVLGAAPVATP